MQKVYLHYERLDGKCKPGALRSQFKRSPDPFTKPRYFTTCEHHLRLHAQSAQRTWIRCGSNNFALVDVEHKVEMVIDVKMICHHASHKPNVKVGFGFLSECYWFGIVISFSSMRRHSYETQITNGIVWCSQFKYSFSILKNAVAAHCFDVLQFHWEFVECLASPNIVYSNSVPTSWCLWR